MTINCKRILSVCAAVALIVLIGSTANADRAYADESLDKLLAAAMENNPEIVTAKAKVVLAQAELNATRLQVARQIISHWYAMEKQRNIVNRMKEVNQKTAGSIPLQDIQENEANLSQLETEFKYLSGHIETAGVQKQGLPAQPDSILARKPLQVPSGPIAKKFTKEFFAQPVTLEFRDAPLDVIVQTIKDQYKFEFVLDKEVLAEAGISPDMPVEIELKGAPLTAALQFFEDQHQRLQFVVRDYGILLTTIDQAKAQGYYPVSEYVKYLKKIEFESIPPQNFEKPPVPPNLNQR
jgi:hypothetical protein